MSIQDELEKEVRDFKRFLDMRDSQRAVEPDVFGVVHRSTQHLDSPTKFSQPEHKKQIQDSRNPICQGKTGMPVTITVSGVTACPVGSGIDPNAVYTLPYSGRGTNYCVWQLNNGTWEVTFLLMDDGTMQLEVNYLAGPQDYFLAVLGTVFPGSMSNQLTDPGGNGCSDFIGTGAFGGTATAAF